MSADVIQAQYEQLDQIAARFGERATTITELLARVRRHAEILTAGDWQGTGVDAFSREMDQTVYPALIRLTDALLQAQSTTYDIKDTLQTAEETAAAGFQSNGTAFSATLVAGTVGVGGSAVVAAISAIFKGVAAHARFPGRYVLRAIAPNAMRGNTTVAMLMDMASGKPGKGLPLIRFDGPHKGTPFPHINLHPKLIGRADPHAPISPRLLKAVGRGARVLQGAGRIALPVAITLDVFRLGSAYHDDGGQIGNETKRTIGSVTGGWGGALAGAKLGAMGGASLGGVIGTAIFPGAGTAVGAGVGGFLGGLGGAIGGGIGGSWVGEKIGGLF